MRAIERSSAFKRDYKREAKGQHRATLDADLVPILKALDADPRPFRDSMIAATAMEHGFSLVTRNVGDLADAGVQLVNPFA
jgi:predicted nucleic acid-binding protein